MHHRFEWCVVKHRKANSRTLFKETLEKMPFRSRYVLSKSRDKLLILQLQKKRVQCLGTRETKDGDSGPGVSGRGEAEHVIIFKGVLKVDYFLDISEAYSKGADREYSFCEDLFPSRDQILLGEN